MGCYLVSPKTELYLVFGSISPGLRGLDNVGVQVLGSEITGAALDQELCLLGNSEAWELYCGSLYTAWLTSDLCPIPTISGQQSSA